MTKTTGLGDNFYVAGYNVSGDTNSLGRVGGGHGTFDSTGIDKYAFERLGLLRDGSMEWVSYFNPAAGQAHEKYSTLPTADVILTYARGTDAGNAAACMVGKQINYDGTRNNDGSFTLAVQAQANGYGIEWGTQLTAGLASPAVTGAGTAILFSPPITGYGMQAYLQVTAFVGTDLTIAVQSSNDNVTFTDVTGLTFTQITAAPTSERKATTNTTNVGQYVRYNLTTSAGFTSVTFSLVVVRNVIAGVVF